MKYWRFILTIGPDRTTWEWESRERLDGPAVIRGDRVYERYEEALEDARRRGFDYPAPERRHH
jgi:hypothetical protein